VSTASDPWGRVAEDGTVFVRTADGEREIGSWQAGSADEALAFFKRKFDSLETEVSLLEQRITGTDLSPAHARATITRLVVAVTDAHAIGDLAGLRGRLEALTGAVEQVRAAGGECVIVDQSDPLERTLKLLSLGEQVRSVPTLSQATSYLRWAH